MHHALVVLVNVLDRLSDDREAIANPLIADRLGPISRKLKSKTTGEAYRLTVGVPMISLILNSRERLAIEDSSALNIAWKQLTGYRLPGTRGWLAIAALSCLVTYAVILTAIQPPQVDDSFEGENGALKKVFGSIGT